MKVYRKVVINMKTGETLYEDSYDYDGPVAKCFGGGASGEVKFPGYQETQHTTWLNSIATIISSNLSSNSPFFGVTAYDPDSLIANSETQMAELKTTIGLLDATADWNAAVDATITKLENVLPNLASISEAVTRKANRLAPEHFRSIGRLAASYGDINAFNGTPFFMALASLESGHMERINEFENQLALQQEIVRLNLIATGIQLIFGTNLSIAQLKLQRTQQHLDMNARSTIARVDEKSVNVDYSIRDALWDTEMLLKGGNLLGALQGGAAIPDKPSPAASALSGALSGFAAGGPVGAAVGGIGGLLSSL